MQKSSAQEASLILTVLLPGAAFRTAQALFRGSSTPEFNALRKPRERLAPPRPLLRFLRRSAGRDTARFLPRSRRGPAQGRTRRSLVHGPIIDSNLRRSAERKQESRSEAAARRAIGYEYPESRLYTERSTAERVNARLKDEFGGRHLRVRGHAKASCHLRFGILALTVNQLVRLAL